ncbi:MAG: hypothetical protein J7M40_02085 [Planctomycetes bacterium]|nr:hypothetical protein [Planctomycetota bacterium]
MERVKRHLSGGRPVFRPAYSRDDRPYEREARTPWEVMHDQKRMRREESKRRRRRDRSQVFSKFIL